MAMSEVQREPPNPRKKIPAYMRIHADTNSSSMFTATTISNSRIPALKTKPTKLSMGLQSVRLKTACFQIAKPVLTIPDGVRAPGDPAAVEALLPIVIIESVIVCAKLGPFWSSQ